MNIPKYNRQVKMNRENTTDYQTQIKIRSKNIIKIIILISPVKNHSYHNISLFFCFSNLFIFNFAINMDQLWCVLGLGVGEWEGGGYLFRNILWL